MTKDMLITIFGGQGLVGRYTVRALAKAGYRMRVGVRRPNSAGYLTSMGQVGQIQLCKVDVRNEDAVRAALKGAHAAINLAGALYQRGQSYDDVHVTAAAAIARAAKDAGVQTLVHVSAIGADGKAESAYARSKAEGERAVRENFPEAAILRPSAIFGPEDKFFNQFAAMARYFPALPLPGGGHTKLQPVFAGDIAAAIQKCIEDPATRGQTYELGGPHVYTFREMMEVILRETGRKRLLVSVPYPLMMLKATFLGLVPGSPLTRDLVKFAKIDDVVSPGAKGFADLGIAPDSVEAIVPQYLWRFRREGQYAKLPEEKFIAASERQ
ncbi:MAG TPA: complex I NDUFA9 subunit family protein [Rhizomicrobium sp.]|nr:complex I NDUFA9 subunit family protein [Rhizomicrobium sp.]